MNTKTAKTKTAKTKTTSAQTFVRGNTRLAELLSRPKIAAGVAEVQAEAREVDRVYAESLANIRKAGDLTQADVAEKLGIGQGVVSRLERRSDMLLSTLGDYLRAAGAQQPRIVVTLNGIDVELDLDGLRAEQPGEISTVKRPMGGKSSSQGQRGRSAVSVRVAKQSTVRKNPTSNVNESTKNQGKKK
jgi:transcriptional regulator with XRE-family HTH domain